MGNLHFAIFCWLAAVTLTCRGVAVGPFNQQNTQPFVLRMHQYEVVSVMSLALHRHGLEGGYAVVTALHVCVNAGTPLSTVCSSARKHNSMNTFKNAQGERYPDLYDKLMKDDAPSKVVSMLDQSEGRDHIASACRTEQQ